MSPNAARIELTLIGGFALHIDGQRVGIPTSGQRVTAFLALHRRPVSRTKVADALWLDRTEERARANLRTALWRLQESGLPLVRPLPGGMLELRDEVCADYHLLLDWAQRLTGGRAQREDLELDVAHPHWELLPEWYDEWVVMEREQARQRWLHALEHLALELVRVGRFSDSIAVALLAIAAEPLRESARRTAMLAHLAEDNYSEAAREYAAYREVLRRDLGVEPSAQLTELLACRTPAGSRAPLALVETRARLP